MAFNLLLRGKFAMKSPVTTDRQIDDDGDMLLPRPPIPKNVQIR